MDNKERVYANESQAECTTSTRFHNSATHNTLALILAGGRGSRLHQLTDWRAKPAVPFGGKFRIIDFPLSNCVNSGVRRIGVVTQYKSQSLIRHIQHGWSFLDGRFKEFVELLPAQQRTTETWYQGTADAVFQNLDILLRHDPKYVLILGGDHIYKMDYSKLLAEHLEKGADMTVACLEIPLQEASAFGVMGVNDAWQVTSFAEKPENPAPIPGQPQKALASMGIYVFNAAFLYEQLIRDSKINESSHDFGKDLIPYMVPRYRVFAHRFLNSCVNMASGIPYWRDVGTVDAYWEANFDLTTVTPELNLYDEDWPIWTHQEQLPPAKFVFDDEDRRGQALDSSVSGGCIISGATVRRSLLFSNVKVRSFSSVEDSVILPNVEIGRYARLRRVVVEKQCIIPEGLVAGYDIEEDRKRFYVTEKGITLITPEMLGQNIHHVR
ncbi:MAG: glucose-1-phosphate adenylyltransferase [Nitrosomonas sp.]|jgi:glucose-1-phosphate adenylyltransferase|uniref:glucose-1-phosphate adenylyltransferase n=1 Tax=Nitrosomonas sp. TaxID=42353 RepID=UPI00271C5265|nr:glucose-1-phosphate adenylyltransferase [Nitrosomonas sp.]MDO8894662.1 glucose-1-phosphate adenylyltransferase [Nitrosomonas sp.]MDO9469201.1 glucose-1-phosphate adenylyltransferase [Nitrosomonas sp.]MDP1549535.1 glucose-1-phosphate adenylyltransferase [Nitrosomonas sp.]MDP1786031.1 glucose-1-phosphate adenylyltransferase [Nitrosomonas sp.]MDP1934530.1 glucose-1-phosphate adenylyltransferase [Nitrosomonas sp.]